MESVARAFRRSCVMVFLRKVWILFKVEKHLSDSAVGVAMRILRRLKVVLHERLEQSQCTAAGLELVVLTDEGQLCPQLGFVQHGVGLHGSFQRCIWELRCVLHKQVSM